MIRIHKENPALKYGSLKLLKADYQVFSYGRFQKDNKLVVAVNNRYERVTIDIPVWQIEIDDDEPLERLIYTAGGDYSTETIYYDVDKGMI